MKTLVFCTSHARNVLTWNTRYARWLAAIRHGGLHADQVAIIDDGSPALPMWPDVEIAPPRMEPVSANVVIFHYRSNLGRQALKIYPGWYRSFCFAGRYAAANDFSRVVHIESDAYIISNRMRDFVNNFDEGWAAPKPASYNMPEAAIQVIAGSAIPSLLDYCLRPYAAIAGLDAESTLPITHRMDFIGDRYGEYRFDVPRDADWVAQAHPEMLHRPEYFWWMTNNG